MLLLLSFIMNCLFMNIFNPLMLNLILFMQTFLISLIMGKIYFSFWFSYIIFLVFIGGFFILFIYIITLTYNNYYYKYKKIYFIFLFIMFIKINIFYINNFETSIFNYNYFFNLNMIKFFNLPNSFINMLLMIYLFIMLVMVIKIMNFKLGSLKT
uniref:NADH dehydrogenase subunit 6 n=1 Tax=Asphondylia rosetta TaxID=420168 RepID=C7FIM6_9DIPT|nr:NADH dehydrogenase subunit 6 [Asphondylia rosetta]